MKTTVSEHDFCQAFVDCGRENQFSWEARKAIFEWLEEMDADCGTETELDPIAICCEFSEHDTALDCVEDCGYGFEPTSTDLDDEEIEDEAMEYLMENTSVIVFNGGIVIQCD